MRFFTKKDDKQAVATPEKESHNGSSPPSSLDGEKSTPEQTLTDVPEAKSQSQSPSEENEDDTEYPHSTKLLLITLALCLSVFCMALDNTILATAIPKITDQFHALDDVGWYASSYLLCTCAFQLFYGKLYTFFSIKWVYLAAIFVFEIGSAVCGSAPNSTAFILGRAIAGLGTAGIFSGAILIVANTVPLQKRPTYTGLIGGMYGIASVAGPLMGGVFTDKVTWRWCFYINLPLGAVTIIFIYFFYHPTQTAQVLKQGWKARLEQFDLHGTAVFLPMVVCLLLALQWGGSKYPWSDGRIIALLVIFAVLAIAFVSIQFWKQDNGTVPPRVFKQRSIFSGAWFGAMLGGAFFVIVYYLPIWFQAIKGVSAVKSGIMNIPMILSLVIASIVSGVAVSLVGYYTPFTIASSIIMSIGAGLLSTFEPNVGHAKWIGYQVLFGGGLGLGMQQTLLAAQTALPKADVPIGTAIMMFSQTLGGALFVSVAQNVFTNRLIANLKTVVPNLNPTIVLNTGATSLKTVIPKQYLTGVLQAYNDAIMNTFYVAVALSAMSIIGAAVLEWRSVKGKKIEMAAA